MLNIKKILLPVDFPSAPLRVIHQAAALARHFRAEIVMLEVPTPLGSISGMPYRDRELAGLDADKEIIREGRKKMDEALGPELEGLSIRRVVIRGDAGVAIVQMAQREKADLIMMPAYGHAFDQFLVTSITPKMLSGNECPVWTDSNAEESPMQNFAVSNILCAVDFKPHSHKSALWAAQVSAEFGARLTLVHVTAGVEFWGPGGRYVNQQWKAALVSNASQEMARLLHETGIKAEVVIGSGDVAKVLSQTAKEKKVDLLVTGCQSYGGYLRTHGYAILSQMTIPVMSV
jgi:nucleotide-binding universal stress UspA family protein